MVVSPFVLMASLALHSRTFQDDFSLPSVSPWLHRRLDAFVEPVRRVEELQRWGIALTSEAEIRQEAQWWVELADRKVLGPLRPAFHGDQFDDGAKEQILLANQFLARRLVRSAETAQAEGRPYLAASDLVLALRLSAILKPSDLVAMISGASEQIRVLELMHKIVSNLRPLEAKRLLPNFDASFRMRQELLGVLMRQRDAYYSLLRKEGRLVLDIIDPYPIVRMASLVRNSNLTSESLLEVRSLIVAARGDVPQVLSLAKIAWQRESRALELAQRMRSKLNAKAAQGKRR